MPVAQGGAGVSRVTKIKDAESADGIRTYVMCNAVPRASETTDSQTIPSNHIRLT